MRHANLSIALLLVACGPRPVASDSETSGPATTSLSPPPGPFGGQVTVRFETSRPATVAYTLDGSDPRGPLAVRSASPLSVVLRATTTVRFFSRTDDGFDEPERSATYTRMGAATGTASGTVTVGGPVLGHAVAVSLDGRSTVIGTPAAKADLPFALGDVAAGAHRLLAIADFNDDGTFSVLTDLASQAVTFTIDPADPALSSAEGLRLFLGASQPGMGSIRGTVTFDKPLPGLTLVVAAVDAQSFSAGADPQALLTQLGQGWRATTDDQTTEYLYLLTNLAPGTWLPVPMLTGLGAQGAALDLIGNPTAVQELVGDDEGVANFSFGPASLHGTASLVPATAPGPFVYGIVAARNLSLAEGAQIVLMPALLSGTSNLLQGSFAGSGLRSRGARFNLRIFTSLGGGNPLLDALSWAIDPLGAVPPHATVVVTGDDVAFDFTVP